MKLTRTLPLLAALLGLSAGAQAYTWDNLAIGGGGFITGIFPSKTEQGLVYARTDVGGAYRYDKAAARWIPLQDWSSENEKGFLGVESLAIDPKDGKHIVMLCGTSYFNNGRTAILRSTDGGANFSITDVTSQFWAHGNGMGRGNGEKLIIDPGTSSVMYVGTRANGLFKSTNWGYNWSQVTSLPVSTTPNANGISFVQADPASVSGGVAQRLFVGVSRFGSSTNFYRSDNAGGSFTAIAGGPSNMMPQRAVSDGAGNLIITFANGAGPGPNGPGGVGGTEPFDAGKIYKFNIGANSWTDITPPNVTAAFSGISVANGNAQRLVTSTDNTYLPQGANWGDHVFISNNGGTSWTDVTARGFALDANGVTWLASGQAIHGTPAVAFDPFDAKAVWVTSGNGLFKTDNIDLTTTTWKADVKGIEEVVPAALFSIPGGPVVTAVGDYDGFRHTNVAAYGLQHMPTMGTTSSITYATANSTAMVRVGNKMYYSWSGGNSWTQTTMNGSFGQVVLSPNGGTLLHSPEGSSTSYRSSNMGASWSPISGLSSTNQSLIADAVNSSKFYAYDRSSGTVFVSTNGGVSFAAGGNPGSSSAKQIRAAPGREGDIWVPLNGGGLSRSTNSGASFSKIGNVSDCNAIGFGKADVNASYPTVFIWGTVGGVRGLFRSTDTGASWVRVNDDAHEYGGTGNAEFVNGDMNTFGVVYMSTAGRGAAYGKP